ncbi:hypothetical protein ACGE0T_07285 [Parabacteroides sp. APC149_11_2_Y6]
MNKLSKDFHLHKYGIDVRLVNESDAAFMIGLRTDTKLSRFIHQTLPDIEVQKEWIKEYKERKKRKGILFYFQF